MTKQETIERIRSFATLGHGWDSYIAKPITPEAIAAAIRFVHASPSELPPPKAFPMTNGGIGFTWLATPDGRIIAV